MGRPRATGTTTWTTCSSSKTQEHRENYALKPMNCPCHVMLYQSGPAQLSRAADEDGRVRKVHRYEPSGALHGIMRVRSFTQDDAHIFCTPIRLTDECLKVNDLPCPIYKDLGFEDVHDQTVDPPRKPDRQRRKLGSVRRRAEAALDQAGLDYTINSKAKARSTAPSWNMSDATPSAATGSAAPCRWITTCPNVWTRPMSADLASQTPPGHAAPRALFGSFERFIGILIENWEGKLPFWLAPRQVVVASITSEADDYVPKWLRRSKRRRCPGRGGYSQRKDQLQGPRALGWQSAGHSGRRSPRSRRAHRQRPPSGRKTDAGSTA